MPSLNSHNGFDKVFIDVLKKLNKHKLAKDQKIEFPAGKKIIDLISFLAEHEAYHVGQLGFLRKYFTGNAVSYE